MRRRKLNGVAKPLVFFFAPFLIRLWRIWFYFLPLFLQLCCVDFCPFFLPCEAGRRLVLVFKTETKLQKNQVASY